MQYPLNSGIKYSGEKSMQEQRKCRICGCTDADCRQCIERTGSPCYWVEKDLCRACRTIVVTLASSKGGVGKTGASILLAKYYAACGLRVLMADSDLNDSLSLHFINNKEIREKTLQVHLAAALSNEANNRLYVHCP